MMNITFNLPPLPLPFIEFELEFELEFPLDPGGPALKYTNL